MIGQNFAQSASFSTLLQAFTYQAMLLDNIVWSVGLLLLPIVSSLNMAQCSVAFCSWTSRAACCTFAYQAGMTEPCVISVGLS